MPLFPRSIPALRLSANPTRNDELNAFLSSDAQVELELEESFASNMSLNSPPHRRGGLQDASIQDDSRDYVPMDISPAPQRVFYAAPKPMVQPLKAARNYERDTNHTMHLPLPAMTTKITGRPRSNTGSSARLFGKDVSNAETGTSKSDDKGTDKGGKKLQRAALPFEWMSAKKEPEPKVSVASQSPRLRSVQPLSLLPISMHHAAVSLHRNPLSYNIPDFADAYAFPVSVWNPLRLALMLWTSTCLMVHSPPRHQTIPLLSLRLLP